MAIKQMTRILFAIPVYIGMKLPLTPQANVFRGKVLYTILYRSIKNVLLVAVITTKNMLWEKNACAEKKYFQNEKSSL